MNPESESGPAMLITFPFSSSLSWPSGITIRMFLLMYGVALIRQSTLATKFLYAFSVQRLLSFSASLPAS